jgi:hypothetical protein
MKETEQEIGIALYQHILGEATDVEIEANEVIDVFDLAFF